MIARFRTPPEPGTILGPTLSGDLLVVVSTENGVTHLRIATQHDIESARGLVRSTTEAKL